MSSKLQLDVCYKNQWWRLLVRYGTIRHNYDI